MSLAKTLFKNTSWLVISQIITSIFGFIWIILFARYLGVAEFGILMFAISFTGLFNILMDLGISLYTTRDLCRDSELVNKYLGNTIPLKIFLSIISFFVILILLFVMDYEILTIEIVLIFTIQAIFLSMNSLFNGVIQAFDKMEYQAIGIIINSFILLFASLLMIFFNLGLFFVAFAYLAGSITTLTYLYIKIHKEIAIPDFEIDLSFWKKSILSSLAFGLTTLFTTIYFMIDVVMLSFLKGDTAVGIYSSAYKIITVFSTLYMVYNFVAFPLMSKLFKNSEELLKISYEKSVKYLLMIMLPIAIGITLYSNFIITLIYGNEYLLASSVLELLIWNTVFMFINGASTLLLNSSNKEIIVTRINGLAVLVNVILNFILIQYYSYIGASIAIVLTGLLICILMNYVISKASYRPDIKLFKDILKIIISGAVLAIILYLINLSFIVAVPVAIIIYLIAIFLTNALDDTDINIIKEIIKTFKNSIDEI